MNSALEDIVAGNNSAEDLGYAGDMSPEQTWATLNSVAGSQLVDVRTTAEWSFVGLTDLTSIEKIPLKVEWQMFPTMEVNSMFADHLGAQLSQVGYEQGPILFLCRSGVRSRNAAIAMTEFGLGPCFNITSGFEGDPDEHGHRGQVNGWKHAGLSWRQA